MPKYLCIQPTFPDYARYHETVQALEAYYAHDPSRASAVIATEMVNLGAELVSGQWYYDNQPVTLIALIRVEDERLQMGDYVADLLEDLGFAVDRKYKTSTEASPIWLRSDPWEGGYHFYTGGWVSTAVSRDQGEFFQFFYTPKGLPFAGWQAYTPTPEFQAIADQLAERDFVTLSERDQLFQDALELSMLDSAHIWLVADKRFLPRRAGTTAAYDLGGGLAGSDLWPYTLRFLDQEGGVMQAAQYSHLMGPWNPIGGTNWIYDRLAQRGTQDAALVRDPNTGLMWPQRIESAELCVEAGLPVTRTLDWVSLTVSPTIEVPSDAWVDWDATNQVWITAGEKFTQTQYAKIKSTVTYPSDLLASVTWHDGSPLSPADFVMAMILQFDVAKPESAIYDASRVSNFESFLSTFRGLRIASTDPLRIEYYTDAWNLDAELNVHPQWPHYSTGESPWHTVGIGYLADADQVLAFTDDKSDALGVGWMDFVAEPSLTILKGYLDGAQTTNFVPYSNTMGIYVDTAEAAQRWANLQTWYSAHGHFWLGTGPFYLDTLSHDDGTLTLERSLSFPDASGKWDHFSHDASGPTLKVNYDTGAPGSSFNITGTNYPINSVASVGVNQQQIGTIFTGESGEFTLTLTTEAETDEGYYMVRVSVNPWASTLLRLDAQEPVRAKEGDYVAFAVPDGIAIYGFTYLPLIMR